MCATRKSFSYLVCCKTFHHKCHVTVQERVHKGERPYQSKTCNKAFKRSRPIVSYKDRKEYTIEITLSIITFVERTLHRTVASKLTHEYSDQQQISSLKTHMKIQSGNKSFHCKVCGKSFCTKSNLRVSFEISHRG